ncbi:MAG: 4-alpha-glucanotransferase [Rhodanobacteraceae bacterium]
MAPGRAGMTTLTELASRAGIAPTWYDISGVRHEVDPAVLRHLLQALGIPAATGDDFRDGIAMLDAAGREGPVLRIVEPGAPILREDERQADQRCRLRSTHDAFVLDGASDRDGLRAPDRPGYYVLECAGREWTVAIVPPRTRARLSPTFGVAAQVYSLRRADSGGLGDYEAVARIAESLARRGADALALSPVHAIFARDPARESPYSPSSRVLLNILHVDPSAIFGSAVLDAVLRELGETERWHALDAAPLVDWRVAGPLRVRVLRALHALCRAQMPERYAEFASWRAAAPTVVEHHARFEAIDVTLAGAAWPADLRSTDPRAVQRFADAHADEIEFHVFAQWLAARGLDDAQARARAAGMRYGLLADLAVGVDPGGSDAWREREALLRGVSIGAPPDLLAPEGQRWGLTTFSPHALRHGGFAPFLELVRATLAHAGGMRVDHVIGLERLWLVPDGAGAHDGAYVAYPRDDLLRLLALEAHLADALIIGEDLGTVPPGFRDRLGENGVLGMSVLTFERDHDGFRAASRWRDDAVALTSTHDLPPLAGWWDGVDLEWRRKLGLIDDGALAMQRDERSRDRALLLERMVDDAGASRSFADHESARDHFVDAGIAQVARTPAPLALVPLEDLCAEVGQPNMPGTTSGHPNWRRRLALDVERLADAPDVAARLATLAARKTTPRA